MAMKKTHRAALADLGVTVEDYFVDYDGVVYGKNAEEQHLPKMWCKSFTHPDRDQLFLEHHADQYGGNWRWYVRSKQGDETSTLSIFKTQREAMAYIVRRWFR